MDHLLAPGVWDVGVALGLAVVAVVWVEVSVGVLVVLLALSLGRRLSHIQLQSSCNSTPAAHLTTEAANWQHQCCNQMVGRL